MIRTLTSATDVTSKISLFGAVVALLSMFVFRVLVELAQVNPAKFDPMATEETIRLFSSVFVVFAIVALISLALNRFAAPRG